MPRPEACIAVRSESNWGKMGWNRQFNKIGWIFPCSVTINRSWKNEPLCFPNSQTHMRHTKITYSPSWKQKSRQHLLFLHFSPCCIAYITRPTLAVLSRLLRRIHKNLLNTFCCQNISKQSLIVHILLLIPLVNIVWYVYFFFSVSSCNGLGDSSNEQMCVSEKKKHNKLLSVSFFFPPKLAIFWQFTF